MESDDDDDDIPCGGTYMREWHSQGVYSIDSAVSKTRTRDLLIASQTL